MSVQALSCAFAVRGFSPSEKLVLLALANYADADMRCFPSQKRLAEDTGLSDRTIRSVLAALEARQVISRTDRQRSDGSRTTDIITMHFSGEPSGVAETISGGGETISGGVGKQLPGGGEVVSGLTTFEPSSNHSKEPREGASARSLAKPNGFGRFWEAYPEKVAKGVAEKSYARALTRISGPDPPSVIFAGLERAKLSRKWREGFIPNPSTWLNQDRWNDEPAEHPQRQADVRPKPVQTQRDEKLGRMFAGAMAALDR